MSHLARTVTLACATCGRTFDKPCSAVEKHALVACPHCAALQPPRPAHGEPGKDGRISTAHPTWRQRS